MPILAFKDARDGYYELHHREGEDLPDWTHGLAPTAVIPKSANVTAAELLAALAAEYERRMKVIAAGYPDSERESWPVQMQEAQALQASAQASTPWIDAAAQARGLTRTELAARIAAKNAAYRVVSGTLTGVRQRIEDEISASGNNAQALAAIDVAAGWPAL